VTPSATPDGPTVSVIVPVRDGAAYLGDALASVLAQDVAPLEVIVVDDGSTDGSAAVAAAAGPSVRVLAGSFGGAAAARNAGVAAARGDLLAFVDHDDLWAPRRLARQVAALCRAPAVELVLGLTQRFRDEAGARVALGPPAPEPSFGAVLATRRAFELVGPLDAGRAFDEDVDWFLRAREARVPARLDRVLVQHYRRHATNATNRRAADVRAFFEAIRDSIARRRAPDGTVRSLVGWPAEDLP
jgi:glycosyltransferase involved in cell wall biosynthesis